jgi:hypothetical protein
LSLASIRRRGSGVEAELCAVDPHAVHDHGKLPGGGHLGAFGAATSRNVHHPSFRRGPFADAGHDVRRLEQGEPHGSVSGFADRASAIAFAGLIASCVGIDGDKRANRFPGPGGGAGPAEGGATSAAIGKNVATGLKLRHDHGSRCRTTSRPQPRAARPRRSGRSWRRGLHSSRCSSKGNLRPYRADAGQGLLKPKTQRTL